jgi:uncharacterized protein YhfF
MTAPLPADPQAIQAFWMEFQRAKQPGVTGFSATVWGRTRAVADELALLVVQGDKRAHATLEREFEDEGDDLPAKGDHVVVLDGRGQPRAIVRVTHVERRYFNDIDEPFAFECGEGDRSLGWWLTAYRQDYAQQAETLGFQVSERAVLILEYFECVWGRMDDA